MNKISIYIFFILIFLGLSVSFSPSIRETKYIINKNVFPNFFNEISSSLILIDSFQTGFLIKSYFQKYKKITFLFDNKNEQKFSEIIIIRTSPEFWKKNLKNTGMSIFRFTESPKPEDFVTVPPGALFVENPIFGKWKLQNSGEKTWLFHNAYKHFPDELMWGDFRPTYKFHAKMKIHMANQRPFYGPANEFGTSGQVTKKNMSMNINTSTGKNTIKKQLSQALKKISTFPKWNN